MPSLKPHKTVFIHMGLHKTGSTFIQDILQNNSEFFDERFCVFHQKNGTSRKIREACLALHSEFEDSNAYQNNLTHLTQAVESIIETSPPDKDILISDEEISGYMPGRKREKQIYPAIGVIAKALKDCFSPKKVVFIIYYRDERKWIKSVYNQAVKQHRVKMSYDDFVDSLHDKVDLSIPIERLSHDISAENLKILSFEDDISSEFGVGLGLFKRIGMNEDDLRNIDVTGLQKNESVSPAFVELMRAMNSTKLHRDDLKTVREVLFENQHLLNTPRSR